ncbi:MAG: hypothetical protein PVI66_13455 [Candidatus Aminicenantes bacterium]|jgi:hypothetical protein
MSDEENLRKGFAGVAHLSNGDVRRTPRQSEVSSPGTLRGISFSIASMGALGIS